ncbi:MAG: hypothetical protein LCI02_24795 [Proteobacteria bacterium]|nr:hypothetical protein [Pseudomonadota bacterium]
MQTSVLRAAAAAVTLGLAASLPAQATLAGFTDTAVDPASYTQVTLHTDPSVAAAVAATAAGNPGAGLALSFTNAGAAVDLLSMIGFVYNGFAWNPGSDGALASVSFTNDRYIDGGDPFINNGLTAFSRALLVQGGVYYVAAFFDAGQPRQAWYTSAAAGLLASDFGAYDPLTGLVDNSQHPDFSAAGGSLSFGFMNRFLLTSTGPYDLNAWFAYDNIGYTLDLAAAAVPEPAALALAALLSLAWQRRRA